MYKRHPNLPTLITLLKDQTNETISSWLARNRHEHRLSNEDLFRAFRLKQASDIDSASIFGGLSVITNGTQFSSSRLINMSSAFSWLAYSPERRYALNTIMDRQAYVSFCTECLKEATPYWQYPWRLQFYRVCTQHKIAMRFFCQYCNQRQICNKTNLRISSDLRKIALRFCCHCSQPITEEKTLRVHKPEIIKKHLLVQEFLLHFFENLKTNLCMTYAGICKQAEEQFRSFIKDRAPYPAETRLLRHSLRRIALKMQHKIVNTSIGQLQLVNHKLPELPSNIFSRSPFGDNSYYDPDEYFIDYLKYKSEYQ